MGFSNLFKTFCAFIKNAYAEAKTIIIFFKNSTPSFFKTLLNVVNIIFCTIKENAKNLKKLILCVFTLAVVLFIFGIITHYCGLFDLNSTYHAIVGYVYRTSASVRDMYWVPYRHLRLYSIKLFKFLFVSIYVTMNAFTKNFIFFRDCVSTTPSYEENVYLLFVWIFLNFFVMCAFVWFLPSKNINKSEITVTQEAKSVKKVFILTKFFAFLVLKLSLVFTWFWVAFKKIVVFLYVHSFGYLIVFLKSVSKKIYNGFVLLWKPIFKKWSYYGIYRTYKSKWLKK